MEHYNIHTSHFHIPQWLPLTVVLIIYRSIFEHMQHQSVLYCIVVDYGAINTAFQTRRPVSPGLDQNVPPFQEGRV